MAILKNTTVSGSLRATDTLAAQTAQFKILKIPDGTSSTNYTTGTNGYIIKTNGTNVYWDSANNHTHNYAGSSSAGGAANSVTNSFIIKINTPATATEGTNTYTFNGSAAKTLDIKAGSNISLTAAAGTVTIANTYSYSLPTAAAGTKGGVKIGTGLTMSGEVLNHSNSITAQSTQALYPIKIDGQGHISAYGTAISSQAAASGGTTLSLVTTGEKYTWNSKTSNTGTVTSITLKAGTGISLDTDNTAITTSGTRTISNTGVLSIGGLTGAVTLADLGLSQALRFIGITSTALSDGATTATLTAKSTGSLIKTTGFVTGDVVIDTNSAYEYVWTGSAWERLGGDSSYKTTQTAFTNSAGSADGTNTSTSFIYSFSQTANGNIIDIKTRALPIANSDTAGITTVGASGGAAAYSHGNHVPTTETANNAKFLRNDNTWQLVTPANIGAVTGNGRVFYGTCSTAASTAEKAVVCTAYNALTNGDVIIVKFDNTNSAAVADLKLNVNSKGAKNIKKQYGSSLANLSSATELRADTIAMFIYNGTYWIMTNCDQNSTYYTTAVYCSTAGDQAAKVGAVSAYTLEAGKHFPVMMIYTNTAQSALTLNISSKGAKPIYINGTASSSSNYTLPQGLYIVYYDGTNYHFRTDGKIPATEFIGPLTGNVTGNVSGTAANVTGTVAVENGGTGATTAAGARNNLGTWALISDSYNTLMPANGTTNGWVKIGTSNTAYGLLPSTSGGAGSGHNYIGTSNWYWKYAYIDQIYGYLNGNISGSSTSCSGNAATATYTKYLMNRGASTVTIGDSGWGLQVTPSGHTNGTTVFSQKWSQSGLTYTPSEGSATSLTDTADIKIWLSNSSTSNVLQANMEIDGMIYSLGGFKGNLIGNCSGSSGSCTGNAATATSFSANKSVTLTGDVTGSASSTGGWSIATTLADSGATAGSYGDSVAQTPGYGATFKVPYITVDAKGRVTAISEHTVKIPASDNTNTDTLVKQTAKSDNVNYKILTTVSAAPTSGNAAEAAYNTNIFANASTGAVSAQRHTLNLSGTDKAYMIWNNDDQTIDFVFI